MKSNEKMLLEAVNNMFKNQDSSLGITKRKKDVDIDHNWQFQYQSIQDTFAVKATDSTFGESLTSAFQDIHSYKFLSDPTFDISLEKRLKAVGVPLDERRKAIEYVEQIREEYKIGKEFDESEAGWHPHLKDIIDTTINADDREPQKSEPDGGGGPTPKDEE